MKCTTRKITSQGDHKGWNKWYTFWPPWPGNFCDPGQLLGPVLFLCYINDFWLVTTLSSVLFADDTTCLGKGRNLGELTQYVNTELQKISNWFHANEMAVNAAKTKYIVFRTQGKPVNPLDCNLVFNDNEIGVQNNPDLILQIERIHNNGGL